ncbi:citrate lyase ACP [Marinilabiliaceae bacterium JC017]|nr:citrate lyase ACP [Marinilabiliaceae bacterium JC017]
MIAESGKKGDAVRSDCHVSLALKSDGGLVIELKSKVDVLYGRSIRKLIEEMCAFYDISNAQVVVEDKGALPFVIAARMEAAIKQLIEVDKAYLLPVKRELKSTLKERNRRSRLYLPGNNPKLMVNAGIYGADGIILDLEDSVAPECKTEARFLVRNALRAINFNHAERMVRINQLPEGLEDLKVIAPHKVNLILIPKCEHAWQVKEVNDTISFIVGKENEEIMLMPIIESAMGVKNAYDIAAAVSTVVALAIGLEDYTADIGAQRTNEATESFHARSVVVNAARAAGVQPIDSVFSDIDDMEALRSNVGTSKGLGFVGMGCIHPRQVPVINECFAPDEKEIEKARKIVEAYHRALENGSSVVALGSKMIDPPVVKRALHVIDTAIAMGKLNKDWRE